MQAASSSNLYPDASAECPFPDRQAPLARRQPIVAFLHSVIEGAEISQTLRHVGVIAAERLLPDRQRPLAERFCGSEVGGFFSSRPRSSDSGRLPDDRGRAILPDRRARSNSGLAAKNLRLPEGHRELVQARSDLEMLRTERLLPNN